MAWNNLDLECALAAEAIVTPLRDKITQQEMEKLCADSTAVLVEYGTYAFFLYLQARSVKGQKKQKESAPYGIQEQTFKLLSRQLGLAASPGGEEPWGSMIAKIANLSEDLNRLLLAKALITRTLDYTRYHAKTLPKKLSQNAPEG